MRIVSLAQGSSDWLLWRRLGIGSSDAPIISNGQHFNRTILDLWQEKTGLSQRDNTENWAMAQGKKYEPEIRAWYEKTMGVKAPPCCAVHDEHDWLRASLDGWVAGRCIFLEIKYAKKEYHEQALRGQVPLAYEPQLVHQGLVTGSNLAHYVSFNPKYPRHERRVVTPYAITNDVKSWYFSAANAFWESCLRQTPPITKPIQRVSSDTSF